MSFSGIELTRYSNWAPTAMDPRGLGCDEYQDWYVAPVSVTRDDEAHSFAACNFDAMENLLMALDPEAADHRRFSFNHWACGYFDILLVRAGSPCYDEAQRIACALADYPIIDDELLSQREHEAVQSAWWQLTQYQRATMLHERGLRATPAELKNDDEIPGHISLEIDSYGNITPHAA